MASPMKDLVIDADAHALEFGPAYFEYLKQVGGASIAERFQAKLNAGGWTAMSREERIRKRASRPTARRSSTARRGTGNRRRSSSRRALNCRECLIP